MYAKTVRGKPFFALASTGTLGSARVEFNNQRPRSSFRTAATDEASAPPAGLLETFQLSDPDAVLRQSYKYSLIQKAARAMSVSELLASDAVDTVLNLTIPAAHAEIALGAIAQGKDVYAEKPLAVTLEEMFSGTTKKLKIKRKTYDQATGKQSTQDRILEVPIKKGLKAGSKIKFSDVGDQVEGGTQDLHFVVQEVSPPKNSSIEHEPNNICRNPTPSSPATATTSSAPSKSTSKKH